jgi:vitamin B12 transporter
MFIGGLNLRWDLLDGAFTQVFKANRAVTDTASTGGFSNTDNLGEQNTYSYLATYRFASPALLGSSHSVSGLIEQQDDAFTPTSDAFPGPFTPDGVKRERGRLATIAEYRGGFFDTVFISGSVRHDDNDKFADFTTWHSGVSVVLPEIGIRPHASAGTGVALPGMFEQFGSVAGIFVGNPDLVPEESFSWDAGVEFTVIRDVVSVDVTYFEADLTNEIAGFGNTLINQFGESTRSGIEVASQIVLTRQLSLGAAYTFLDARDPKGLEEVRRPRHSGRADIKYLFDGGRGTFDVAAVYNGDMTDNNFGTFPATIVPLDEYWLVTVAASYHLTQQFEVFGRVENALDEQYEEVSGYNTLGVAAYAGVRMTLEDPSTASWAKYK